MSEVQNKRIIMQTMRNIYYPKGSLYIDWMGFKITEINFPSYHHIKKAENLRKQNESDKATIDNGAYLGKQSHDLLHHIEYLNKELYKNWNNLFLLINKKKCYPIEEIWQKIYILQDITLKEINKEKVLNSKKIAFLNKKN